MTVDRAVKSAEAYLFRMIADANSLRLEEVEMGKATSHITLSFIRLSEAGRSYKQFAINTKTGKVVRMKTRALTFTSDELQAAIDPLQDKLAQATKLVKKLEKILK